MTAVWLHVVSVHLPVVGCPVAAILVAVAVWRRSDLLLVTAAALVVAFAAATVVAYYSGPGALEALSDELRSSQELVERHALLGRGAFAGMVVLGALALQMLLRWGGGEPPARWMRWALLVGVVVLSGVLAWAAHLGGHVGHPELRV